MNKVSLVQSQVGIRAAVVLADGRKLTLEIEPGRAYLDNQGYIRMFSVDYEDGTVANLKLLPRSSGARTALELITNFLLSLGLARLGGKVVKDNSAIKDMGLFIVGSLGTTPLVHNVFDRFASLDESAYYDFNGDLVIVHPIRIKRP